ncbi:MAG: tRNA 2-thiouridine(34) synthase MnmA [Candidatus Pacebacteria bacterium]|nr:tRNA 2-thiouridine(34) synthase MnmA [Candidatus Paceibacterota bacterium]
MQKISNNIKKIEANIYTKKVYVGLSGGVDSSVAATLLKKEGYDVRGVFIKIWHPDLIGCDWKDEMRDAMRVAAHLEIPFEMVDLADVYREKVIQYMTDSYKKGETPNPDVMCNTYVKFGVFYDWAINNGADFVATGHYAQIEENEGEFKMLAGIDNSKDQSYFLWNIRKECLQKMLLPIGKYTKKEVREIAEKNNLPTAKKADSQGLCFIGDVDLKSFLKNKLDLKSGNVVNAEGEIIGTHNGSELYTIGERHGFSVSTKKDSQEPLYVLSKDLEKNIITVGEKKDLEKKVIDKISIKNINLLVNKLPEVFEIAFRYQGKKEEVEIESITNQDMVLKLKNAVISPAVGQSAVFYKEGCCLGGGVIQ